MADFAQNLAKIRAQKNISQETLSRKSGISQAAISMIEKGQRSPSEATMNMLAKALRVPLSDLLQENEEKPAASYDGLDEQLIELLMRLPEKDSQRVKDFVSGLLASQEE